MVGDTVLLKAGANMMVIDSPQFRKFSVEFVFLFFCSLCARINKKNKTTRCITDLMAVKNIGNFGDNLDGVSIFFLLLLILLHANMFGDLGSLAAVGALSISNYLIMTEIAFDDIVLTGIYAATLSSGIAALVGALRIIQAVAQDNVFIICSCVIGFRIFMIAYLLINFSCFTLEIRKSPGWRSVLQYFIQYSFFLAFARCLLAMFLIRIGIYVYIDSSDPQSGRIFLKYIKHYYVYLHKNYMIKIGDKVF